MPTTAAPGPTLVQELLPGAAATSEAFTDAEGPPEKHLYPEELEIVEDAVPSRRREFATGRVCARRALRGLGVPPAPLLRNRRGAPQWPEGVTGSMTHCAGYRAAAVARRGDVLGLGIDAEPNEALPEGVLEAIALPREQEWVAALSRKEPGVHWGRLLFSAKESVFKVWYPLTRRELGFEEALIEADPDKGTFTARVLVPAPTVGGRPLDHFSGRWLCREGLLLTAVTLLPAPVGESAPTPPSGPQNRRSSGPSEQSAQMTS
ncbi:4'-phosphopantetheinyl transferase family protein [Streptomyces albiaxialis]|uniref:4'-phosphopantetheinyl transferase family protein n=1 Tax=Streptomyces albiaxialis TaxID=329523 RepID=UPI0031DA85B4